jgi:hypothetical protein
LRLFADGAIVIYAASPLGEAAASGESGEFLKQLPREHVEETTTSPIYLSIISMKTLPHFVAVLTVITFSSTAGFVRAQDGQYAPPPPPDAQGDQSGQDDQGASFQTFYDQLGDQGTWVQTDNYGYVFQPNVSDPNWAPYTDGHWAYTDEGWTWVSDEPWGWATYHYGRWANIDGTGWVWVPGYRWAPAWVSWRYGGGYAGWAPLPPETFVGAEYGDGGVAVGVGFHFGGDVDVNFNIGPGCYNFLRVGDMGESNYRGRFIDRSRNYTVINNTTNITNINVNKTVVNNYYGTNGAATNFRGVAAGGPPINDVNAHARQHIKTVHLTASTQPGRSNLQGNSLSVYAPRVNPASAHQAKPAQVSQTIANPTFNRGDSIAKPLAVTANIRPAAPSAEAIQSAQEARRNAPANARIANENTPMKTTFSKPLTSMEPVAQTHRTENTATPGANAVRPEAQQPGSNGGFTGESVKPASEHHAATDAYTGEPARTEATPNEVKPATTYHSQTENTGGQAYHPSETQQAVPHHTESEIKPAQTFHPQSENSGGQAFHPQPQVNHEAVPHTQAAPAPASHSAPPANKPAAASDNKKAADAKTPPGH